jgi:hypothetical protein
MRVMVRVRVRVRPATIIAISSRLKESSDGNVSKDLSKEIPKIEFKNC